MELDSLRTTEGVSLPIPPLVLHTEFNRTLSCFSCFIYLSCLCHYCCFCVTFSLIQQPHLGVSKDLSLLSAEWLRLKHCKVFFVSIVSCVALLRLKQLVLFLCWWVSRFHNQFIVYFWCFKYLQATQGHQCLSWITTSPQLLWYSASHSFNLTSNSCGQLLSLTESCDATSSRS